MEQNILESTPMTPNSTPIQDGSPYFMGDHALVKFSDGGESDNYWLLDKKNHTIRPFESDMALDAVFGDQLEQALRSAMVISTPSTDSSGNIMEGVLADFSILGSEYAIHEDGTSKPLQFSPHQLKDRYGKPIDEKAENLATEVTDGFLTLMKKNEDQTGIPANFIEQIKKDSKLMAFYISSLAYGNYMMEDIYSDIARRYHDDDSEDIIHPTMVRDDMAQNFMQ